MNKKGYFIKIIPEGASYVKDFYFSPFRVKFLKILIFFLLFIIFFFTGFSIWMVGNFARMKMLEYQANKVKRQEEKIKELESKLKKFVLFAKKMENLLKPAEKKIEFESIRDIPNKETEIIKNEQEFSNTFLFELPLKGIISNFYSVLHPGIDIVSPSGSPIRAPLDGIVKEKGVDENFGLYLWIEHKGGIKTFYAHLKEINVRKGEWVKKGEIIARVGSSGKSTGPHLHFEIWKEGFPVNPLDFANYNIFTLKYRIEY